jgi:hypothetical protein
MVRPIDYTLDVLNPIEGMLRGYSLGRQDIEQRQVMQEREQVMGIRGQQEARAQQQFEAQQAAAARQRAQAAAMQEQLMGLREMALEGTLTSEALDQFALANVSTFDEFRSAFQSLSEPRRQETTQFNLQLNSSLFRGNTGVAMNMLDTRIAAAENAGTPEAMREAAALKAVRGEIELDPIGFAGANLANMVAQGAIDNTTAKTFLDSVGQRGEGGPAQIRSSTILDDGTVVTVTDAGPVVYARTGEVITGQAAADAVREAQEFGADVRRQREAGATAGRLETEADLAAGAAGARAAGTAGIEVGLQTFERIGSIQSNISNLDRAIELVEEEGANTGVLASRFPGWGSSTIELRQLRNVLGLDVIGSVAFGALSESELQLALDTALPTNLSEDALADWLRRKRDAQEALVDNLTMQAQFLSVPGRTLDQWIDFTQSGGSNMADMRSWMRENPVGRRAPAAERTAPAERPEVTADRQFITDMQAKIDAGETLTPEDIARLNRIAGQ